MEEEIHEEPDDSVQVRPDDTLYKLEGETGVPDIILNILKIQWNLLNHNIPHMLS